MVKEIEFIKDKIKDLSQKVDDQEEVVENIKLDLEDEEESLKELKQELERNKSELEELYILKYPEFLLVDESDPGKFEKDNKFYLCNGFILVESLCDFPNLPICSEPLKKDISIEKFITTKKLKINLKDIDKADTGGFVGTDNTYLLENYKFKMKFVDNVLRLLGRKNIKTVYIFDNSDKFRKLGYLYFETEVMRAIVLGVTTFKE